MGRTVKNRKVQHPKPVERIALSERNFRGRLLAVILLMGIGVGALIFAFMNFLAPDSGWREISVKAGSELSCGEDFTFKYRVGVAGVAAPAEIKALTQLYSDAAVKGYELFCVDQGFEGVQNVYEINQHPGEVIQVDEVLYDAFALMKEQGRRELFLAPVYAEYENLFACGDDVETVSFDPYQNQEVAEEFAYVASCARDPQMIDLELLGNGQVRLQVAEEYRKYAEEMGYTRYLDFFWMKNAFLIDYLADTVLEQGYRFGILSSVDGFVRNLDDSGEEYSFPVYDLSERTVYQAAVMKYRTARSIVYLHGYGMASTDAYRYYEMGDGTIRTPYVDLQDGLCRNALPNLVSYSDTEGCARVLLRMMPVYIAPDFEEGALAELKNDGISSIWCREHTIYCNDDQLELTDQYQENGTVYTVERVD